MCFWLSAALDDPYATLVTTVAWWSVVLNLLGMREQSATPAMAACISIHACRVPESPQAFVKCDSDTRLIKSEHGGTLQAGKCFGTPGGPPDAGPIKQASRGGSGRFCTRLASRRSRTLHVASGPRLEMAKAPENFPTKVRSLLSGVGANSAGPSTPPSQ